MFTKGDWSVKKYDRWILTYNALFHETKLDVENYKQGCLYNISKSDDDRRQCTKYSVQHCSGFKMEIPPEYDDVNIFSSYGPKTNSYIQQNEFPHDLPWYWRMKAKADIELGETEKKKLSKRKKNKKKKCSGSGN